MPLHPVAAAFADAAPAYEQGRPEYPEDAVEFLVRTLSLAPPARVLEVGAGTGKFTRSLRRGGAAPVAVEPVGPMRSVLRANAATSPVLAGTAEQLPVRNGSVDAIVVAQAFHWFRPSETVTEFARVLRSGGGLGLVWNVRDESVPWVGRFGEIVRRHEPPDSPHWRSGAWKRAFEGRAEFVEMRERSFTHVHTLTREATVARALSVSYVAALPAPERDEVAREVRALLRTDPALAATERIPFPYRTDVFWTFRA